MFFIRSTLAASALLLASAAFAQTATSLVPADLALWQCTGNCGTLPAGGDITLSPLGSSQYAYVTTSESVATDVSPIDLVEAGGQSTLFSDTNGSRYVSPTFAISAGQTVSAWFNYVSTDGKGFDDYAWSRLINVADASQNIWLFTARSTNSNKQSIVPGDLKVGFDPDATIVNYASFDFQVRNIAIDDPIDWAPLGFDNGTCWRSNAEGCGFTGWLESSLTVANAGNYQLEVGVVNFGDTIYNSGLAFDIVGLQPPTAVPEPSTWAFMLAGLSTLVFMKRKR
jgi:PEP-CTERM motif